jgi:hypothetical protein
MSFLSSIAAVSIPLAALFLPGAAVMCTLQSKNSSLGALARSILWSITVLIVSTLAVTLLQLPVYLAAVAIGAYLGMILWQNKKLLMDLGTLWQCLTITVIILIVFGVFSIPFLLFHEGLPTGDAQKAILWAQHIIEKKSIPEYSVATSLLNRDPADFYTPGLHTVIALLLVLTPHTQPITVGFFAIALGIGLVVIAGALATEIVPSRPTKPVAALLSMLILVANPSFLRYVREPGYHLQNLVGELLLFGLLLLSVSLIRSWHRPDAILAACLVIILPLTHQFSAFLGIFILLPPLFLVIARRWKDIATTIKNHALMGMVLALSSIALLATGIVFDIHRKIPHLFNENPHLALLLPKNQEYLLSMGTLGLVSGFAGLLALTWNAAKRQPLNPTFAFAASTSVLLLLSQGPRIGIDIPPMRTFIYSALPLCIASAYIFSELLLRHSVIQNLFWRSSARLLIVMIIAIMATANIAHGYELSHSIRTNATLRAEYFHLIKHIADTPGKKSAVLIDDYNQRSSTWLLLAEKPLYSRVAEDIQRIMDEAEQSPTRQAIYLKLLDFEKIFALGSQPEVTTLMAKHSITWVTGISERSATSFTHNPALKEVARGDGVVLYERDKAAPTVSPDVDVTHWLLKSTTLANDIGDTEDTEEYLPASVRTTRLSEPRYLNRKTLRFTSAPYIPLEFNVQDYTRILWNRENIERPDIALELYIRMTANIPTLTVVTPTGTRHELISEKRIRIDPHDVSLNDQGTITLTIHNPTEALVGIDLIALGLARTP